MSSNIWTVLNNVDESGSKIQKKSTKKNNQRKPSAQQASPKDGNKPQLTAKAARAFSDGQKPKQPKKPSQPKQNPEKSSPQPSSSPSVPNGKAPKPQQPAIAVKQPAVPASVATSPEAQQKIKSFLKALDQVLNGQSAFFPVELARGGEQSVLQSNPYRVVVNMVKGPQFISNMGLALKQDAREFTKKDMQVKILGRVNRVTFAHHLLSLLSGVGRAKPDQEATRLVTGFFEAIWNLPPPPEPVKRAEFSDETADEVDEILGSAGNVKRDVTLSDFITIKTKGGKSKGKQQAGKAQGVSQAKAEVPKESETQPQPETQQEPETKVDPLNSRPDLLDTAKLLAKRIPFSFQCVRVEPNFLWSAEEVKASGKQQQHYFKGEGCDHCYAFWEEGKSEVHFLVTN